MAGDKEQEELLRRAKELGEETQRARDDTADADASASERLAKENWFFRGLANTGENLKRVLGPIGTLLAWLLRWFGKWLRWVAIAPPDPNAPPGKKSGGFSATRLAKNLAITVFVLFCLQVTWRALYYYGTGFEETVYVTGKQEIETGELYQFGGCTSLPCSTETDNGKFYLIESSLYLPMLWYPEEEVFANIPHQDGACNVRGFGIYFRAMRWVYKRFQLYQHVVNVSCRPYTEEEIRKAVSEGEIVRD